MASNEAYKRGLAALPGIRERNLALVRPSCSETKLLCDALEAARERIAELEDALGGNMLSGTADPKRKMQGNPHVTEANRHFVDHEWSEECTYGTPCFPVDAERRCVPYWPWAETVVCQSCGGKWRGDQRPAPLCPGKPEPKHHKYPTVASPQEGK